MINLAFRTQPAAGTPRAPSMGWDYSHVYNPHNLENVRVICHGSKPVSSVGIYPTQVQTPRGTIGVGGINAVGTHPDYRRLGLATLTMQDAAARMREIGLHVGLLSTGITNWYRKLGWERAGRQRTFTFDRRNITYLPDAPALASTIEAYAATGARVGGIRVDVTAVGIAGDEATATYDVVFGGKPAYQQLTGKLHRAAGGWAVSRSEFCSFMSSARAPCA
jgi:GNAT superfamily N-acetyltransferase